MFILSRLWWTLVLRGIIAILFGVAAFSWPHLTFQVLIQLFGIFALLDGIFTIAFALTTSGFSAFRWPVLVEQKFLPQSKSAMVQAFELS